MTESARSSPRVAIAWVVGAILVVAWIGWAIYVTTEHGSAAGLGVLISWPVAIAAIALVVAPFVGVYLLVQRNREPALAGSAGLADGADRSDRTEHREDEGGAGESDAEAEGDDAAGSEADGGEPDEDAEDADEPDDEDEPGREESSDDEETR